MSKNCELIWHTEKRKIKDLVPTEGNPRQLTEKQTKDLKKSLEKFNLVDIPAINLDNRIISGHQRVLILKSLNSNGQEIEVRVPNRKLTEDEHREYLLRANKNNGQWDFDLLANFDEDLLKNVGFESTELDKIFQLDSKPEDDEVPENPPTIAKLGDIWMLGRHRVMCGDSTQEKAVSALMGGKKADMVFTDPPYGINVVKNNKIGGVHHIGRKIVKTHYFNPVRNDDKKFDPSFLLKFSKNLILFGANNFCDKLPISSCWIVWDKMRTGNFPDCELAWTSFKLGVYLYKFMWNGAFREGDKNVELNSRIHPTQKPVGLCSDILNDFSKHGEFILDLFLGSGSTLIACEKTNRICYGMEIDPHYCDVIVKRWEDFTRQKAEKISG